MKLLLLHPEDSPPPASEYTWDLIVDLGRAPVSTYQGWSRKAGCRVISLYDLAEQIEDLRRVKTHLQFGMGQVVDRFGIDWWDVTSLLIVDDLLRCVLVGRLAKEIGAGCDLYVSRPSPFAEILRRRTGGTLRNLEKGFQTISRRARHYAEALAKLDAAQVVQVLQDKLDPEHRIRRQLATRGQKSKGPVTLLPSGYINVSRMAVAYAAMLPEEKFILVYARKSGNLKTLPENVQMASLDSYSVSGDQLETASLLQRWKTLKIRLLSDSEVLSDADASGALARIPALLRSGVAVRNAWNQVFERENVTGCLSTDDTAPDSRIPLILAQNRGIAAVACHHGALDQRMAIKKHHGDFYLAKGEMERDYLQRVCLVGPEKLLFGGPSSAADVKELAPHSSTASWLVFFTEPYQADAWRGDEVYRDLLPRLSRLAKSCGLDLVFKLHPFESAKSMRRLLRRYLPASEARKIQVIAGPISSHLWQNTKFAMTVQSTVALGCSAQGIPIFLCAWLCEPFGGYVEQYARFGIGCVLNSAEQIAEIPRLLEKRNMSPSSEGARWKTIEPATLHNLLHGAYRLPAKALT